MRHFHPGGSRLKTGRGFRYLLLLCLMCGTTGTSRANENLSTPPLERLFSTHGTGVMLAMASDDETRKIVQILGGLFVDDGTGPQLASIALLGSPGSIDRALPGQVLQISAHNIGDPSTLRVRFEGAHGFHVSLPLNSAEGSTVTVSVPPFFNSDSERFEEGPVQITLVSGTGGPGLESRSVPFTILALPTVNAPPGTISLEMLDQMIQSLQRAQVKLNAIELNTSLYVVDMRNAINRELSELQARRDQIQNLIINPGIVIPLGTTPSGAPLQLDAASLALSDQLIAAVMLEIARQSGQQSAANDFLEQLRATPGKSQCAQRRLVHLASIESLAQLALSSDLLPAVAAPALSDDDISAGFVEMYQGILDRLRDNRRTFTGFFGAVGAVSALAILAVGATPTLVAITTISAIGWMVSANVHTAILLALDGGLASLIGGQAAHEQAETDIRTYLTDVVSNGLSSMSQLFGTTAEFLANTLSAAQGLRDVADPWLTTQADDAFAGGTLPNDGIQLAGTSCCQQYNGCPDETGTSCGNGCCCCPYGQRCSGTVGCGPA